MKIILKTIGPLFLLFIFPLISNGQFNFGFELGANASTQSGIGDICDNMKLKSGLDLGIIAKYQFNEWLALRSGLNYVEKGRKCDFENQEEITVNYRYLILPAKLELSTSDKTGFKNDNRLYLATGPYFGRLLSAETEQNLANQSLLDENENYDFGWSVELGMQFPTKNQNAFQVSLHYDMGLVEVSETESELRNKTFSLRLGYIF